MLSQLGTGFTLFYAPIFFVNHVHLSATQVGIGLGSASLSGILGRILGGSFADTPLWGRRRTLLLSMLMAAVASFVLAIAADFPLLVIGNLLMGLGVGLYWPATEAVVADLTHPHQRSEAYALTRLGDNLGLGMGVVLGGLVIGTTGAFRLLFVVDGLSFLVFFGVIYGAIAETRTVAAQPPPFFTGWYLALGDRPLQIYGLLNILLTAYIAQVYSTLPLYFSNFVHATPSGQGFSSLIISALFTWYLLVCTLCQLPTARALKSLPRTQVLRLSAWLWGLGFVTIGLTGVTPRFPLAGALVGLGLLAIATVTYLPAASSLVVELAPEPLRGTYLSINSLGWAIGYLIGQPLGGLALDQPRPWADGYWGLLAASVMIAFLLLHQLDHRLAKSTSDPSPE